MTAFDVLVNHLGKTTTLGIRTTRTMGKEHNNGLLNAVLLVRITSFGA
jgi:hypothetical protein